MRCPVPAKPKVIDTEPPPAPKIAENYNRHFTVLKTHSSQYFLRTDTIPSIRTSISCVVIFELFCQLVIGGRRVCTTPGCIPATGSAPRSAKAPNQGCTAPAKQPQPCKLPKAVGPSRMKIGPSNIQSRILSTGPETCTMFFLSVHVGSAQHVSKIMVATVRSYASMLSCIATLRSSAYSVAI